MAAACFLSLSQWSLIIVQRHINVSRMCLLCRSIKYFLPFFVQWELKKLATVHWQGQGQGQFKIGYYSTRLAWAFGLVRSFPLPKLGKRRGREVHVTILTLEDHVNDSIQFN